MKKTASWLFTFALPPLALLVVVLVAWDRLVVFFDLKPYLVPRPARVWQTAWEHRQDLASATWLTAAGGLCGFAGSLAIGTLIALVFAQSRIIQRSVYPYAIFLQTVPIVAIAPVIITWFGTGFISVVVVAFIISVFPIITNATTGLTSVDRNLLELFELHNASRAQTLVKLRLPGAVPYLVTGAKISCGLSIIGAIVGEFFAGFGTESKGLGYLITQTSGQLKTDYLFAAVFCCTLLGITVFATVSLVGSTILARWQTNIPQK